MSKAMYYYKTDDMQYLCRMYHTAYALAEVRCTPNGFAIFTGIIQLDDYSDKEKTDIISQYYGSLERFEQEYSDAEEQNQLLAEMLFESTDNGSLSMRDHKEYATEEEAALALDKMYTARRPFVDGVEQNQLLADMLLEPTDNGSLSMREQEYATETETALALDKMCTTRRLFVDMDGVLAAFTYTSQENLLAPGYFRNLPPQPRVLRAVSKLCRAGFDVYVLSAVLNDTAAEEKREWLKEYLPDLPEEKIILSPCGEDKSLYVPGGIREDDVLLDDFTRNLEAWRKHGTAVKLLNGINGTKGSWTGKRVSYKDDMLAEKLADVLLND